MNWNRGLLRVWVVASVIWVMALLAVGYFRVYDNPAVCFNDAGDTVYCSMDGMDLGRYGPRDSDLLDTIWPWLAFALAGPLAAFGGWYCLRWVRAGFDAPKAQ